MRENRSGIAAVAGLVTGLIGAAGPAAAYPIPPANLWQQAADAERIVVAQVVDVSAQFTRLREDEESSPEDRRPDHARLQVLETLKGPDTSTIDVEFDSGFICPAPPRYLKGRTVLAFLISAESEVSHYRGLKPAQAERMRAERKGKWHTANLSYGTLYPTPEDLPVIRQALLEALDLQAQPPKTAEARRAWALRTAQRRATRWHGLLELRSTTDEWRALRKAAGSPAEEPLAAADRLALMRGFVEEPDDDTLDALLALVGREPDADFDRTVLGLIERRLLDDEPSYDLARLMGGVLERLRGSEGRRALGLARDDYGRQEAATLRRRWADACKGLRIPRVPPGPLIDDVETSVEG